VSDEGLYQLLPPLSEEEHAALVADIQANGILVPVIVDQHEAVIDGHHRQQIADELGIECPKVVREFSSDDERYEFALGLNLKRRHLSREQMRQLIAGECARTPDASDREIARRLGVSHRTVATVRRPEVDNLSTEEEEPPRVTYEEAIEMTKRLVYKFVGYDLMCLEWLESGMSPAVLAKDITRWFREKAETTDIPDIHDDLWRYVYAPRVEDILSWDGTEHMVTCTWCGSEFTSKLGESAEGLCSMRCWEADLRYRTRAAAPASRG
jgi:hypothetical protein